MSESLACPHCGVEGSMRVLGEAMNEFVGDEPGATGVNERFRMMTCGSCRNTVVQVRLSWRDQEDEAPWETVLPTQTDDSSAPTSMEGRAAMLTTLAMAALLGLAERPREKDDAEAPTGLLDDIEALGRIIAQLTARAAEIRLAQQTRLNEQ
jgi:hypothetical protein